MRTLVSWFPSSENMLCNIKWGIFTAWIPLLGFLFFSPHCETLEVLSLKTVLQFIIWRCCKPASFFYRTKGNRVKLQQGETSEVERGRDWEGGRKKAWASEPSNTIIPRRKWTVGGSMVWEKKSPELARVQESWISVSVLLITCCVTLYNPLDPFKSWFPHQYKEISPAHLAFLMGMI